MNISFGTFGNRSAANWEAEIKAARDELRLHGHEMSEYERNVISREIKRRQEELIPVVGARVIGEFHGAIGQYKNAQQAVQAERTKEINRWDSVKLNAELQLIQTRVDLALKNDPNVLRGDATIAARLQQVYSDAVQSGDLHKQRAAVEILKAVSVTGPDRIAVNQLAREAEKAEMGLRQTEGTIQAGQALRAATDTLGAKRAQLDKVSQVLGLGGVDDIFSTSPFAKAARLVEYTRNLQDGDGGPQGEIIIHNENDPEVTGILWK